MAVLVAVGCAVLAVGGIFLVQHLSEKPEAHRLTHDAPPAGFVQGKVVLSLSSALVMLAAGPQGGPLRVESSFDPDVYTLAQQYREGDQEDWTYRLDFHEKTVLHISVIGIWLGKRSPMVTVLIPPDLPFDLEATMEGGCLAVDVADLALSNADVELNRGVLHMSVPDPMDVPMERLRVRSRIGTMRLVGLGNASPASQKTGNRLSHAISTMPMPMANSTWNVSCPLSRLIRVGSSAAIIKPRITMSRLICDWSAPRATLRSILIASAVPARNTNVGAHRWLAQRVRNSEAE